MTHPTNPDARLPNPGLPDPHLPGPASLRTEAVNAAHPDLDQLGTADLVQALLDDQRHAVDAARRAGPALGSAADAALPRLRRGDDCCTPGRAPAAAWVSWTPPN